MAQPSELGPNGALRAESREPSNPVSPGKRKRDSIDGDEEMNGSVDEKPVLSNGVIEKDQKELVKTCFEALVRYVGESRNTLSRLKTHHDGYRHRFKHKLTAHLHQHRH
jgi:hypothetical protein